MHDMTINQVRQKRAAAEEEIGAILSRLARETGLFVSGVTVEPDPATTRKIGPGDAIGGAIAAGMKGHVVARVQLEAL